jgi:hypothetical protein
MTSQTGYSVITGMFVWKKFTIMCSLDVLKHLGSTVWVTTEGASGDMNSPSGRSWTGSTTEFAGCLCAVDGDILAQECGVALDAPPVFSIGTE